MNKLLIVTRHTPLPWEDGAGAYLHDIASFLASHGFRVEVLWLAPHEHIRWSKRWRLPDAFDAAVRLSFPEGLRFGRSFIFPAIVWLPLKANLLDRARRCLRAVGINPPRHHLKANVIADASTEVVRRPWASPPSAGELEFVQRFAEKHRPHTVMASYAWMCPLLALPALKRAVPVCLTHDIGWQRAALTSSGSPEISCTEETAWLQPARIIVAISESDAGELRRIAPASRVIVAPKALPIHPHVAESAVARLIFVGSDNAFNVEGLTWFLSEIWPRIRKGFPAVTLDICGSIERAVALRPDGVVFHGIVPSLKSFYERSAIAIVPLRRATGLNIKLVEAAAFGRAIVATPATLKGAPFLRGALIVADSPEEFAEAVLRLLESPAERTATAARVLAVAREHLSPGACYGPLAALLHQSC
ncbi:glycosyltransferase [Oleiharenicola lentus]|uniref:glycosyltransferase n=1 Tax=Oleiharenicola lentus TaxID=2508720 RepID=UPI003F67EEDF